MIVLQSDGTLLSQRIDRVSYLPGDSNTAGIATLGTLNNGGRNSTMLSSEYLRHDARGIRNELCLRYNQGLGPGGMFIVSGPCPLPIHS